MTLALLALTLLTTAAALSIGAAPKPKHERIQK